VIQLGDNQDWVEKNYNDIDWDPIGYTTETGVFWVRFKITLDHSIDSLQYPGVQMISVGSYEAYWDGELIYKNGVVGVDKNSENPGEFVSHFILPDTLATYGTHTMAVRVSNHHNTWLKGSWNNFYIEEYLASAKAYLKLSIIMSLLGGIFLIIGLYYFISYVTQPQKLAVLLFSVLCLLFFGLIFMEFLKFFYAYPYHYHYQRLFVISALTIKISILTPHFLYIYFRLSKIWISLIVYLAILAYLLFHNHFIYDFTLQKVSTLMLVYSLFISCLAIYNKKKNAIIVLVILILIALINAGSNFNFNLLLFNYDINLFLSFTLFVASFLYFFIQESKTDRLAYEESLLISARLKNELLRKNLRPHFIMNTLTSIMEWVEQSPKESIVFISALASEFELLDEMADQKLVMLEQEIGLCRKHIEIMHYRKGIDYEWTEEGIDYQELIPPAIFHTLLENGITHTRPDEQGKIRFKLRFKKTDSEKIYTFVTYGRKRNASSSLKEGTGTKYIRSRLTHNYGNLWNLSYGEITECWETSLSIKSNS